MMYDDSKEGDLNFLMNTKKQVGAVQDMQRVLRQKKLLLRRKYTEQGGVIYEKNKKGVDDKIALRYEENRADASGREIDSKVKRLLNEDI
jgi:hypothetical protein